MQSSNSQSKFDNSWIIQEVIKQMLIDKTQYPVVESAYNSAKSFKIKKVDKGEYVKLYLELKTVIYDIISVGMANIRSVFYNERNSGCIIYNPEM